jgi:two-component system NtrC family sensor kinase
MDGAVVVSVSVAVVEQIRRRSWTIALWLVPCSILVLTLLIDLLGDRFVHRPLAGIREAIQHAADGDLAARAPLVRDDELGRVSRGLNDMLDRLQNFSAELQQRVDEATRELQQRNTELVDTYQRVLTLREALARAEQMAAVGQTAASVAHQVGTPLNLVSGYVQMMREEEGCNERLSRRLAIVADQIERVTAELRTILDRTRLPAARQPMSLAQLVGRVAEVVRPRLERQEVKLQTRIDPACPLVEVDVVQLELALLNLVTNSLDALTGGGTIAIEASPSSGGVVLRIRDTGPGIPPDLLPRVFDPWVTTKVPGRGTGLGLSIAKDVIHAHGGGIAAQSDPGAGATIVIDLPAAQAVPAKVAT